MISQAQRARELGISPAAMNKRIKKYGLAAAMAMPKFDRHAPRPRGVPAAETTIQPAQGVIRAAYKTDLSQMWPERNSGENFRVGASAAEVAAALARRGHSVPGCRRDAKRVGATSRTA